MSLFSGMNISSSDGAAAAGAAGSAVELEAKPPPPVPGAGRGKNVKEIEESSTKHRSEEKSSSAFGFVQDLSTLQSDPPSKFGFINSSNSEKCPEATDPTPSSQEHIRTSHTDTDLNFDLNLDFELDPLKPGLKPGHRPTLGVRGTDLEGIDFSRSVNTEVSSEDCSVGKEKETTRLGGISSGDKTGQQTISDPEKSNKLDSVRDCNNEKSDDVYDGRQVTSIQPIGEIHADQNVTVKASKFGFVSSTDIDSKQVSIKLQNDRGSEDTDIGSVSRVKELAGREERDALKPGTSLYDLELDIGDTLEVLQEAHVASEQQLRSAHEALIQQLEELGKRRLEAVFSMILKQKKLDRLRDEQAKAIAEENYEQAEILTENCTSLEVELHHIPQVTLRRDSAVGDIISSSRSMREEVERQRAQWIQSYQGLETQQETVITRMREGRSGDPEGQRQRLDAQRTELDRKAGHVLLDKNHVAKREVQLWNLIDDKTADLRQTRDELQHKKTEVQDEITALEEKLAKLRSVEAGLSKAINKQEEAIESVKAEFTEEVSIINEEKSNVAAREERLNEEKKAVDEEETALAEEAQSFNDSLAREEGLLLRISESLTAIQSSSSSSEGESCEAGLPPDLSIDMEPNQEITALRERVEDTTDAIQSTSALILTNQTKLVALKKRVTETEDHIVSLQAAKQLAVSTKNFGEAKRLAEEIKCQMGEGQSHQAEVEKVSDELRQQKVMVEDLQQKVEKLKAELEDAEKNWELELLDGAKEMMVDITATLDNQEALKSPFSRRMMEIEQQGCSLLVGWLSDRHKLPLSPAVAAVIAEFEEDLTEKLEDADGTKTTITSAIDEKAAAVKAEIQELEDRLQIAVDDEDYDAAERIQASIECLQHQTDTMV